MKSSIQAVSAVCAIMMFVIVCFIGVSSNNNVAQAAPIKCTVHFASNKVFVRCDGFDGSYPIPVKTITLPPVTVKATVEVPGPTKTVKVPGTKQTISVPGPTKTVKVPSDEKTVYITKPGERVEVTKNVAGPTQTVTVGGKTVEPTATATKTVAVAPKKTDVSERIEKEHDFFERDFDIGDGHTTVTEAGLGLLSILGLMGIGILSLYTGYILGYKDNQRHETNFIRALLDAAKIKPRS